MMLSRKKSHKFLVDSGAPVLPKDLYYYPRVVFVNNVPLLRMEVRRRKGWFVHPVEGFHTVDPHTYFKDTSDADQLGKEIVQLCLNARNNAMMCVCDHG